MLQLLFAWLNEAGLAVAIVGGLISFHFGFPQPSFQEYVALSVEPATPLPDGRTANNVAAAARSLKSRYECLSRLGLSLIIAGFGMQFIANLPALLGR